MTMKQHKWHKEIKAWSDGAEIEVRETKWINTSDWFTLSEMMPSWDDETKEFRIKPQPKEPQYLYVYQLGFEYRFSSEKKNEMQFSAGMAMYNCKYIGKIKLEQDDE